jgi:hypothetical protein
VTTEAREHFTADCETSRGWRRSSATLGPDLDRALSLVRDTVTAAERCSFAETAAARLMQQHSGD